MFYYFIVKGCVGLLSYFLFYIIYIIEHFKYVPNVSKINPSLYKIHIMDTATIIGHLAAFLTTISFLPQAIKTIRSRETKQLSLGMYILFVSGVILWTCYGVAIDSWPIIIGNVITLLLAGTILFFKLIEQK